MAMEKVGFIGLGNMGGPVARHIQAAGFPMVVCDVQEAASLPFLEQGARLASSPAEVADQTDVIFSALPGPREIELVATGPEGVLTGIHKGAVYVDISTNRPALIRDLEAQFRRKGAYVLEAPVLSGQPGTAPGIHSVLVGGEPEAFQRAKAVLEAFGDQILYTGLAGSANTCKLIHQLVGTIVSQGVAEGLTLGVKSGVDLEVVWECMRRGFLGRMYALHELAPRNIFTGDVEPSTFPLTLLRKDVGLATELGREHGVPLPAGSLVEQILVSGVAKGWSGKSGYAVPFLAQEESAMVALRTGNVDPAEAARYVSTDPGRTTKPDFLTYNEKKRSTG